ncbi:MFS transporter [Actinoplanes subtropicus]|uniref:MFS transporter n=1 Tax=Actinoplanes subtropicus TaxID=543632 RepID=UPI00054F4B10|nr:MFS transporter [Actinoplanes subtropicus]
MTQQLSETTPPRAWGRHAAVVLAVTSAVVFMVFLDATIVNVAFETISRDLHAGAGRLAWVLNAYSLAFAATLIPAGRLADRYGRRRVFLLGVAGFTLFSALCGFAPNPAVLVAGRGLQGLFAALVIPTALALLLPEVPPARRHVAVATQAAMGAAAAAVGPTIGALLIEYGSWRWVFLVNVPIGLLIGAVAPLLLRESRDPDARGLPDPAGALLIAAIPALLSFSVVEGPSWGWADPWVVGGFALAALLVPVLGRRSRTARYPALDLALFRVRQYRLINAASLLFAVAFYGLLLANIIFLQTVWHYSVLRAALASAPGPLMVMLLARFAGRLAGRVGFRPVLLAGAACWGLAAAWFALTIGPTAQWTTHWLPPALLTGIAIGLTLPVQSGAAVASLPAARFGLGSAINASFRQLGAVLGVSLFVAAVGDTRTATTTDYHRVWWILGAVGLTSGLILLLPRPRHR